MLNLFHVIVMSCEDENKYLNKCKMLNKNTQSIVKYIFDPCECVIKNTGCPQLNDLILKLLTNETIVQKGVKFCGGYNEHMKYITWI